MNNRFRTTSGGMMPAFNPKAGPQKFANKQKKQKPKKDVKKPSKEGDDNEPEKKTILKEGDEGLEDKEEDKDENKKDENTKDENG